MTEIHQRIEAEIPCLRRYPQALVRDVADADDLVQECLTRAMDLWREGSNLRVWLLTILHNQYVEPDWRDETATACAHRRCHSVGTDILAAADPH